MRIDAAMAPFQVAREFLAIIPGVSTLVADVIIAETGVDMARFETPGRLASWAGLSPGSNESAGRVKSTRTRPGNRYLKGALGVAALSIARHPKDSYQDPGSDYFTKKDPARAKNNAVRRLQALGYNVTLTTREAA